MMMDIHAILKQLPHRYPFLLVDRVLELERNQRIKAVKNVTFNEPYFMGHFPGHPVMPGVLILEALAQAVTLNSMSGGAVGVAKVIAAAREFEQFLLAADLEQRS